MQLDGEVRCLTCEGAWDLTHLPQLENSLKNIKWPVTGIVQVDGSKISKMDSAGAWLIAVYLPQLLSNSVQIQLENFSNSHTSLLSLVELEKPKEFSSTPSPSFLEKLGKNSVRQFAEFKEYLSFVGKLSMESLRIIRNPSHIRWNEIASVTEKSGVDALPIVALLSFMIGVVLAYQMGVQLRSYGANIYIVDLLGLSLLREFGPLITAIMVAGRTGSAFTAQLGIMKINEEIDALDTMGVTPAELLLLPRIIALVIVLPLLTMWADIFGVFGGMIMSNNMLDIGSMDFLRRFEQVVPLKSLLIGLVKTPVFALIIASIGCFEGMRVQGSASSIGKNTTRSVVLGIFFIIVADAIFSIIFSKLQL